MTKYESKCEKQSFFQKERFTIFTRNVFTSILKESDHLREPSLNLKTKIESKVRSLLKHSRLQSFP